MENHVFWPETLRPFEIRPFDVTLQRLTGLYHIRWEAGLTVKNTLVRIPLKERVNLSPTF